MSARTSSQNRSQVGITSVANALFRTKIEKKIRILVLVRAL